MYIKFSDFEDKDGHIDWRAYHAAQVANGERCSNCGGFSGLLSARGHPTICLECDEIYREAELNHHCLIRCPSCHQTWKTHDDYELYEEGEHTVFCPTCDAKFEVTTKIKFTFISPRMENDRED